ncbi:PspC domain-containing protein [Mesonia sp. HuA40]|uniref:PspC domain-containing protein n=1 Tax=Mesonia sp. HuA40 TaxID=2602761 RepID=UPI0011C79E25|nr:PspC domain-containing protein [Mesonia sp. HuA40]TXK70250.1 PspC domain-containing protein [Mesonia sp. HuA40]
MNKTININLGGILFHIDEPAYLILKNYLDNIRSSFKNTPGCEEIMSDIENRIAELLIENQKSNGQIISVDDIEKIIKIMGQPEDYKIESEEHQQPTQSTKKPIKKLFRDTINGYVGGICSGLEHYFKIDAIWFRLLFIALAIASFGTVVLVYIALWIFIPEAKSATQRLHMIGEQVNISNIEKQVKEKFHQVSDKLKDVDYKNLSTKARRKSSLFFEKLSLGIKNTFRILVQILGYILITLTSLGLIALTFTLISFLAFGFQDAQWFSYIEMVDIGLPFWIAGLTLYIIIAIPLIVLLLLGIKICRKQDTNVSKTTKYGLLLLWVIAIFTAVFLGLRQISKQVISQEYITTKNLNLKPSDTLYLTMKGHPFLTESIQRKRGLEIKTNNEGDRFIFSKDINLIVKKSHDSLPKVKILKKANATNHLKAIEKAKAIHYNLSLSEKQLYLDSFFTTELAEKHAQQKIEVHLLIPENMVLFADKSTKSFHLNPTWKNDLLQSGEEEKFLRLIDNQLICLNCDKNIKNLNNNLKDSITNPNLNN